MYEFCLDFIKYSLIESIVKYIVVVIYYFFILEVVVFYYKGLVLNSVFVIELSGFIVDSCIDVWVYGYLYINIDVEINGIKVVCN